MKRIDNTDDGTRSRLSAYLEHSFTVWSEDDRFGVLSTVMVASFRYLLEAIDYCQYCAEGNTPAVLRSTLTSTVGISHYGPEAGGSR